MDHGVTFLEIAARLKQPAVMEMLIQKGADINGWNGKGCTALYTAIEGCFWSNSLTIKLLIHFGANVNSQNKDGNRPLHAAVRQCRLDIIKLLLQAGANSRVVNKVGQSPLDLSFQPPPDLSFQLLKGKKTFHSQDLSKIPCHLFTKRFGLFTGPSLEEEPVKKWKYNFKYELDSSKAFDSMFSSP